MANEIVKADWVHFYDFLDGAFLEDSVGSSDLTEVLGPIASVVTANGKGAQIVNTDVSLQRVKAARSDGHDLDGGATYPNAPYTMFQQLRYTDASTYAGEPLVWDPSGNHGSRLGAGGGSQQFSFNIQSSGKVRNTFWGDDGSTSTIAGTVHKQKDPPGAPNMWDLWIFVSHDNTGSGGVHRVDTFAYDTDTHTLEYSSNENTDITDFLITPTFEYDPEWGANGSFRCNEIFAQIGVARKLFTDDQKLWLVNEGLGKSFAQMKLPALSRARLRDPVGASNYPLLTLLQDR